MTLLTDEIRALVGRSVRYPPREEIGRAGIRYFALALGDANPLYRDDEAAQAAGHASLIAPPTFICDTSQYADGPPDQDGYLGHLWPLPRAGFRQIRAGNTYTFHRPVLPSDRVSVTWTLEGIEEKRSRRGGTQLFVTSLARYEAADGELLATNREVQVLQPLRPAA